MNPKTENRRGGPAPNRFLGNLKTKGLCFESTFSSWLAPAETGQVMSAHGPSSAPQGCSVSPDNRAALHATASCFAALHATASCFAIGYRDGLASPRPTVCLDSEVLIKIGNASPLIVLVKARSTCHVPPCQGTLPRYLVHGGTLKVHLATPPWTLGRREGPPLPPYLGPSPPR